MAVPKKKSIRKKTNLLKLNSSLNKLSICLGDHGHVKKAVSGLIFSRVVFCKYCLSLKN